MGHLRRGPTRPTRSQGPLRGRRSVPTMAVRHGDARTEGRFALFSEARRNRSSVASTGPAATNGRRPAIVEDLGYESPTLAQLRARLTSLKIADLEALLALRGGQQGPRAVPDAARQQDHPRVGEVTRTRPVPGEPVAGAGGGHPGGQVDRPARHGVGRGPDRPAQRAARTPPPRSWCCATRPPTCHCR